LRAARFGFFLLFDPLAFCLRGVDRQARLLGCQCLVARDFQHLVADLVDLDQFLRL